MVLLRCSILQPSVPSVVACTFYFPAEISCFAYTIGLYYFKYLNTQQRQGTGERETEADRERQRESIMFARLTLGSPAPAVSGRTGHTTTLGCLVSTALSSDFHHLGTLGLALFGAFYLGFEVCFFFFPSLGLLSPHLKFLLLCTRRTTKFYG